MNWINLAQNKDGWSILANAAMKFRVPWDGGNFSSSWATVSF